MFNCISRRKTVGIVALTMIFAQIITPVHQVLAVDEATAANATELQTPDPKETPAPQTPVLQMPDPVETPAPTTPTKPQIVDPSIELPDAFESAKPVCDELPADKVNLPEGCQGAIYLTSFVDKNNNGVKDDNEYYYWLGKDTSVTTMDGTPVSVTPKYDYDPLAHIYYNLPAGDYKVKTKNMDSISLNYYSPLSDLEITVHVTDGKITHAPSFRFAEHDGKVEFRNADIASQNVNLPGAVFEGFSCTQGEADLQWNCESLNDYNWFNHGYTDLGTTLNHFGEEIPMTGGWGGPAVHCISLRQVSAPEGYIGLAKTLTVCNAEGGWTTANVPDNFWDYNEVKFSDKTYPSPVNNGAGWAVYNDEATATTILTALNEKLPTPKATINLQKVDENGQLLAGAEFAAEHCQRSEQGNVWSCEQFSDQEWFNELTTKGFTDELLNNVEMTGYMWDGQSPSRIRNCIAIWETKAPVGYLPDSSKMFACIGPNGWTVENALNLGDLPLSTAGDTTPTANVGGWTVSNSVNGRDYTTTFSLVNKRPGMGGGGDGGATTPVVDAPASPSVLPTPLVLPHTGASRDLSGLLVGLMAALATYGAVYFAQNKRR